MKRAAPWWIVVSCLAVASCRQPGLEPLDRSFQLRVGQAIRLPAGELELVFDRVASDSRCPRNVTCVWAGEAVVELTGRAGQNPRETFKMRLPANGTAPDDTSLAKYYEGYRIQLLELDPYPTQTELTINPTAYVATLRVVKP